MAKEFTIKDFQGRAPVERGIETGWCVYHLDMGGQKNRLYVPVATKMQPSYLPALNKANQMVEKQITVFEKQLIAELWGTQNAHAELIKNVDYCVDITIKNDDIVLIVFYAITSSAQLRDMIKESTHFKTYVMFYKDGIWSELIGEKGHYMYYPDKVVILGPPK